MGLTQHAIRRGQRAGGHEPALAPRQHRETRRRPLARYVDIATSRAIARWASGRHPGRPSSTRSNENSVSHLLASTGSTRSTRSRPCTRAALRSSWRWAATSPPPRRTRPTSETALERCQLTVHVATKLNRTHLLTGGESIVLPCLGRTERDVQPSGDQFVTVEDSMACVHRSRGKLEPASALLRSEPGHRRGPRSCDASQQERDPLGRTSSATTT